MPTSRVFFYGYHKYSDKNFKIILNNYAGNPLVTVDTYKNISELNNKLTNYKKNVYIWGNQNQVNPDKISI